MNFLGFITYSPTCRLYLFLSKRGHSKLDQNTDYTNISDICVLTLRYLALGVNKEGHKKFLGMWLSENESAKFW